VIGAKWLESAKMLKILAVWGAFMPIQSMRTNLLVSRGRSRIFMWGTIVQGLLTLSILLAMSFFGIKMMLVAYCVFNILWLFVWNFFVKKEIRLSYAMFIKDILPYMALAIVVMCTTSYMTTFVDNIYILLISKIATAASLYIFIAYIIRSEELFEIMNFLFKRKRQ
jgi:O-antigen/teichoic acid export membrane protein